MLLTDIVTDAMKNLSLRFDFLKSKICFEMKQRDGDLLNYMFIPIKLSTLFEIDTAHCTKIVFWAARFQKRR